MVGSISVRTALRLGIGMGASAIALGGTGVALAQTTPAPCAGTVNDDGICVIENNGASGRITITPPTILINNGIITGTGTPAIGVGTFTSLPAGSTAPSMLRIINSFSGLIQGTNGTAIAGVSAQLVNTGRIIGNVQNITQYVADGGTLNGNLTLGSGQTSDFSLGVFVQRATGFTGVSGTINAGNGVDIYATSYSSNAVANPADLPASFEVHGIEMRGANTTVTTPTGTGLVIGGLALLGDGNFVNTARINTYDTTGANYPVTAQLAFPAVSYLGSYDAGYAESYFYPVFTTPGQPMGTGVYTTYRGGGLNSFTNDGRIVGDIRLTTAGFTNNGRIDLSSAATGTLIFTAEDRDFSFTNTGAINFFGNGARLGLAAVERNALGDEYADYAIRVRTHAATVGRTVTLDNSGDIAGGFNANVVGETISFQNSGFIFGGVDYGVALNFGRLGLLGVQERTDFEGETASFVNTSTGLIEGGADVNVTARNFTFQNAGEISYGDLRIEHEGADESDADSFSFDNSGTIVSKVVINTKTLSNSFTNSGEIRMLPNSDFDPYSGSEETLELEVETIGNQTVDFTNSGTIVQGGVGSIAASFELGSSTEAPVESIALNIVNSGAIRSDQGGSIVDGQIYGYEAGSQVINNATALFVEATATNATVSIENTATGVISATGSYVDATSGTPQPATNNPTAFSTAIAVLAATNVTIDNAGTIAGGAGVTLAANQRFDSEVRPPNDFLAGAILTLDSTDTVFNRAGGSITGSINLGAGDDRIENYGSINGNVLLGSGNDTFIHSLLASLTGTVDGGEGIDSLFFDITGTNGTYSNALRDQFVSFENFSLIGTGTVTVEDGGELDLDENTVIESPGPSQPAVSGGAQDESVTNAGTVNGDVDLGGGNNQFANSGTVNGNVATGGGNDNVSNSGNVTGNVDLGDGNNQFANSGSVTGNVSTGSGTDNFTNTGTITGNVALGGGADTYTIGQGGTVTGTVDGGSDGSIDQIIFNVGGTGQSGMAVTAPTPTATLNAATIGNVAGFEELVLNGSGVVGASGSLNVGTIVLAGPAITVAAGATLGTTGATTINGSAGADAVYNNGTITGGIALGGGADTLANGGRIEGAVDLGAGDDTLTIGSGASFLGAVSGGTGSDTLALAAAGTEATPYELNGGNFAGFERLTNASGVAAVSGTQSFGQIDVTGGRLIGRAGSVLTGNVSVASGATFGSAGRIIGNVSVATGGTLSPGASPGVMTVTGNVALATGTTTIFEFQPSPAQSDQLLISGTLNIANGATLNLTGNRPLTPGVAYDLIVATGGITGTFTTVNQASTVLGFLRYSTDRLSLLGTFVPGTGTNPQVTAQINYVNTVLVGGASSALLAAVPSLLSSDGTANAAAFSRVGPEAYASATELGVEHGLILAKAGRGGLGTAVRTDPGLFAFIQGIGDWSRIDGNAAAGISGARSSSWGLAGGLGFGSETASVAAFVGAIDSKQEIAGLGARTDADGMVAGLIGRFSSGGFDVSALAAYDWSDADTSRAAPSGNALASKYKLRSLVLDASAGYAFAVSEAWAVRPTLGITHISTDRGAATETGNTAFALAVLKEDRDTTFVDGTVMLKGGQNGAAFKPWVEGGVRHLIDGNGSRATAGFVGSAQTFSLAGVSRDKTVGLAGVGASIEMSETVRLYGAYRAEFGNGNSHNVNVGVRIGF